MCLQGLETDPVQVGSLAELAGAVLTQIGGLLEVPVVPLDPKTIFSPQLSSL